MPTAGLTARDAAGIVVTDRHLLADARRNPAAPQPERPMPDPSCKRVGVQLGSLRSEAEHYARQRHLPLAAAIRMLVAEGLERNRLQRRSEQSGRTAAG